MMQNYIWNQSAADQTANFRISGNGYVAGNMGIGTTGPGEKLHVNGDFRVQTGEVNSGGDHLGLMAGCKGR